MSATLRVLVITVVHVPLDARIWHRQIRALLADGVEVTYAAPFSGYGMDPEQHGGAGLHLVDLPRAEGRHRLTAIRAARRLLARRAADHDLVLLADPDLLATLPGLGGMLGGTLGRGGMRGLGGTPIVWDVHEDTAAALTDRPWVPAALRGPAAGSVRGAERLAERRCHLLLAEHAYAPRFSRPHPVVPNVPVLPDEVDPPGPGRAVYLGRVSAGRGAHLLLEVARRLAGEVDIEVLGPADPEVRAAFEDAERHGLLRWHGFVPNDAALARVRGATAGLSLLADEPNYRVSLPTKLLEYLAYGVPVVTTPLPAAKDLVAEADAGIVVPFDDPDAAADAVRALHADADRRAAMGARGRDLVAARYSWDVEGPRFVAQLRAWAAR